MKASEVIELLTAKIQHDGDLEVKLNDENFEELQAVGSIQTIKGEDGKPECFQVLSPSEDNELNRGGDIEIPD